MRKLASLGVLFFTINIIGADQGVRVISKCNHGHKHHLRCYLSQESNPTMYCGEAGCASHEVRYYKMSDALDVNEVGEHCHFCSRRLHIAVAWGESSDGAHS